MQSELIWGLNKILANKGYQLPQQWRQQERQVFGNCFYIPPQNHELAGKKGNLWTSGTSE